MTQDTYTMLYTCSNCETEFEQQVHKGTTARGQGGKCPYCGTHDDGYYWTDSFAFRRPQPNENLTTKPENPFREFLS